MNALRVLIVGGDGLSRDLVAHVLPQPEYAISIADYDAAAARHAKDIGEQQVALIVLGDDPAAGFDAAQQLKSISDLPILFHILPDILADVANDVAALGDDFILSPLQPQELRARLLVMQSRLPARRQDSDRVIEVDGITMDFARSCLVREGKTVRLSPIEAGMLHILVSNAPRAVKADTLRTRVWTNEPVSADTLRVHMHRLRSKLEEDAHHPVYIRTERGVGYRFAKRLD